MSRESAADIVELDSLLRYAEKYNIPLDYAMTIFNCLFLYDPSLDDDDTFRFRMPIDPSEVNADEQTGELIEIGVLNYREHGMGNVTWIGIEGVNIPAGQES